MYVMDWIYNQSFSVKGEGSGLNNIQYISILKYVRKSLEVEEINAKNNNKTELYIRKRNITLS